MMPAVRAVVLASLLFLPSHRGVVAVQASGDSAGLEFLGFRPGARLDELDHRLRGFSGILRCRRSRADQRVSDCRASLRGRDDEPKVELWVSAIDSLAGVMTLSSKVDSVQLESWRGMLQDRYGTVGTRVQGTQRMLQWVRRGRMIRLTWRKEGKSQVASVSLVDGYVLDSWGRARTATKAPPAPPPANQPVSRTR
jgi:hypothetical protein